MLSSDVKKRTQGVSESKETLNTGVGVPDTEGPGWAFIFETHCGPVALLVHLLTLAERERERDL